MGAQATAPENTGPHRPQPVIKAGVGTAIIVGVVLAIARGLAIEFDAETRDLVVGLVVVSVPVIANWLASRFVTPLDSPVLPEGTLVNNGESEVTSRWSET
jgi:hypothetical protein